MEKSRTRRARSIRKTGRGEENGPSIEAIVFDAYGTLFDLESFARDAEELHRGKGKEISRIVRQKQVEFVMTRTILGKYLNFEILTRNAIEFALKETGIARTDPAVEELFLKFQNLKPYKDAVGALSDLDELGLKVAVLSNGTDAMLEKLMEHAGANSPLGGDHQHRRGKGVQAQRKGVPLRAERPGDFRKRKGVLHFGEYLGCSGREGLRVFGGVDQSHKAAAVRRRTLRFQTRFRVLLARRNTQALRRVNQVWLTSS